MLQRGEKEALGVPESKVPETERPYTVTASNALLIHQILRKRRSSRNPCPKSHLL